MNTAPASSLPDPEPRFGAEASPVTWAAALIAVVGVVASVYLSVDPPSGRGLRAGPLCLYQRVFIMGAAGVLITGLMFRTVPGGLLCELALPASIGGLITAVLQVSLEARGVLECPRGILDLGSVPQQGAAMFGLLTLLLLIGALRERIVTRALCASLLGALFAWGAFQSLPKTPPPTAPYPKDVNEDGCRLAFTPNTTLQP